MYCEKLIFGSFGPKNLDLKICVHFWFTFVPKSKQIADYLKNFESSE